MVLTINPLTLEELCHEVNICYDKIKHKYNQNNDNTLTLHTPKVRNERFMQVISLRELVGKAGRFGHAANECRSGGKRAQGNNSQSNTRPAVAITATGAPNPNDSINNQGGGQQSRFKGTCMYCNKVGHHENQCFSKMRDQSDAATMELAQGNTPTPTLSTNQTDHFELTVIESRQEVVFLASSYANC
jgi:hypothetical protein